MRLADLLPLFPLDLVLFPETPLPLHIFEPRYREMIGECLREKREFGVIRALAQEDESESAPVKHRLADCGCTAEIVDLLRSYPDGRMDILVAGRRRFEVIAVDDSRSFFRGEVRFVEDVPAVSKDRKLQKSALEAHYQLMLMTSTEAPSLDEKSEVLSFHLAHALPVDLDFKQALLEMRSEEERLSTLLEYYEKVIPKLKVMASKQKKAGSNGWVH
jgi:uncharacterized protein